ncbi:hypothetical protein PUN28_001174 [Cardiocondyla obscurior]
MKNDSNLCQESKFLYDSEYTKLCRFAAYPTDPWNKSFPRLNNFLCLGIYDTAYKICHYSSQLRSSLNSTAAIDSYVEKYVPKDISQKNFCKNLQGFTPQYDKIHSLWQKLAQKLSIPHMCEKICFDFDDKLNPLCIVFAWIKSVDDDIIKSAKRIKPNDEPATERPHMNQPKGDTLDIMKTESLAPKNTELNESKEPNRKITTDSNNNNNVNNDHFNLPNSASLADVKFNEKKAQPNTEKSNLQKKLNSTLETQTHKTVSIVQENKENVDINVEAVQSQKNPLNSDLQVPSINKAVIHKNKKIGNEANVEKNKEQDNDDVKPSTLSENTQEHYDAVNPDINVENDMEDVDDTIQHPDTGNQNENMQEVEAKNNDAKVPKYSNIRTEDDSHFFTYLTVITLACLAGYIVYHNKQKILAIVLEGRRSRNNRGRRRPSTASYRKLDCTLEEAVTSQCNANVTHVIY